MYSLRQAIQLFWERLYEYTVFALESALVSFVLIALFCYIPIRKLVKITEIMENALLVTQRLQKVKDLTFVKGAVGSEFSYMAWFQNYKPKPETTVFVLVISRTLKSRQ